MLGSAAVFDATHVVASFAFGLAFGPALLRMLARVRARLEISWEQPPPAAPPRRLPGAALLGGPPAALALLMCVPLLALGVTACANASRSADEASASPDGQAARASPRA